jgi:hypothetical protein
MWDLFQDSRWHVVEYVAHPEKEQKAEYMFLPSFDLHWNIDRLMQNVSFWSPFPIAKVLC